MFWESVLIAFEGLKANKLRALLTMLGIIIGVGAVIAMVSIGLGVQQKVQSSIASLGSNLLIVMPGANSPSGGVRLAAGSNITLTRKDAEAIGEISGVNYVAPAVSQSFQIIYGNQNWVASVSGTTAEYLSIRNFSVASGTFFSDSDDNARSRVAVLGQTVVTNLFGDVSPLGQTIRIGQAPFRVIGVLESKGQSANGQDQDDIVLVPLSTAQDRLMGITHVNNISIQAASAEVIDKVQSDVTTLLRTRHRLAANVEDDFSVRNLTALMATVQETTGTLTMFLGAIAAISLVVGGIGIMNIMLVSVTERTREIGIRKALGATFSNILLQFLIEAIVISVTGGLVGILAGVASARVISLVAGLNTVVSSLAIFAAFSVTIMIGVFFGIYPARKAALLDPIDALRYE
ncbi:MAG TPA: ABC transporter permease [Methylomusa anaerophila]|uniref:Macrolide export ATP-binding/permease protein MacB n=1 Tax=Methylomusa anaerophila TaxID=1930071 RepID=A0A348AM89_9FIRM|nr:ABC transporter permease [Methylomusa anaerophila]BBB92187.1 macrolide export ATP-binding/permease protein MacB [Methylomusa anaerophila]HML87799.1 ABC transporter permease [Methylomusa anaerophila]